MTKEQINTMEAGAQLDALIAERVMGWRAVWVRGFSEGHFIGGHFQTEQECRKACVKDQQPIQLWETSPGCTMAGPVRWQFSFDVAAAMTVVEKLGKDCIVTIERWDSGDEVVWRVRINSTPWKFEGRIFQEAVAPTVALAICRCALASSQGAS